MGPGAVGTGKGQDCGGSCITSKPGIKPLAASVFTCVAGAQNVQTVLIKCLSGDDLLYFITGEGKGHASSAAEALWGRGFAAAQCDPWGGLQDRGPCCTGEGVVIVQLHEVLHLLRTRLSAVCWDARPAPRGA